MMKFPSLLSPVVAPRLRTPRTALTEFLFTTTLRHEPLTLVQPHLDANLAVGGAGFGEPVIDVRTQGLQRQLAVQIPLGPGDLGAIQTAGHPHLDAARTEAQRRLDRLAHRPAE